MKTTTSRILIAASLVAALVLGLPLLRAVCLIAYAAPGEHTFVAASRASFVRSLLISFSPFALYAASFALDRRAGWSRFGKLGFSVQVAYGLLQAGSSIYVYHLVHTLDRTA